MKAKLSVASDNPHFLKIHQVPLTLKREPHSRRFNLSQPLPEKTNSIIFKTHAKRSFLSGNQAIKFPLKHALFRNRTAAVVVSRTRQLRQHIQIAY
ncbi:hypothetical protein BJL95_18625 [Methylomonas sp. LWB]|nr:hypothetical protein BJL95_18625 [Methylomonas sp. LWB]